MLNVKTSVDSSLLIVNEIRFLRRMCSSSVRACRLPQWITSKLHSRRNRISFLRKRHIGGSPDIDSYICIGGAIVLDAALDGNVDLKSRFDCRGCFNSPFSRAGVGNRARIASQVNTP